MTAISPEAQLCIHAHSVFEKACNTIAVLEAPTIRRDLTQRTVNPLPPVFLTGQHDDQMVNPFCQQSTNGLKQPVTCQIMLVFVHRDKLRNRSNPINALASIKEYTHVEAVIRNTTVTTNLFRGHVYFAYNRQYQPGHTKLVLNVSETQLRCMYYVAMRLHGQRYGIRSAISNTLFRYFSCGLPFWCLGSGGDAGGDGHIPDGVVDDNHKYLVSGDALEAAEQLDFGNDDAVSRRADDEEAKRAGFDGVGVLTVLVQDTSRRYPTVQNQARSRAVNVRDMVGSDRWCEMVERRREETLKRVHIGFTDDFSEEMWLRIDHVQTFARGDVMCAQLTAYMLYAAGLCNVETMMNTDAQIIYDYIVKQSGVYALNAYTPELSGHCVFPIAMDVPRPGVDGVGVFAV